VSDQFYEKLLDSLFDGVYYVDMDKRITFWNKGAERITGYPKSEVIGSCCANNILRHIDGNGRELCLDGCPLSATLIDGKARESEVFLHHKLGHRIPVSVRVSPVRDAAGNVIGCIEVFTVNSSALQIVKELEDLKKEAYLDALSGVGNRRYGEMSLSTRLYEWETHGIPFGVIFLDIDHFKRFNDTYGHKTGDDVLIMIGNSISNAMRKMDIAVRWGGEEFLLLLPGINKKVLGIIAERIRIVIEHSFIAAGTDKLSVTASIGATLAVADDTAETVIKRADTLMYQSKASGRNVVTIECQENQLSALHR
jgi:diguanylate cyclase (GGDEF)-like protein/PAS domain S-box-containing protein